MNTHRNTAPLLALMVVAAIAICHADDKAKPPPVKAAPETIPAEAAKNVPTKAAPPVKPPTEAELRAVITKSLGFLAKAGDEWMAAKNCNGCHHLPELLWSHREARHRGFDVEPKKFDEWLEWSVENASKKPGPQEVALMILAIPDRPAPELTKFLAADHKPDAPDAQANSIRLSLHALANPAPPPPPVEAASAKTSVMLPQKDAPATMESLVFRAVHARRFGKAEEADALRNEILKLQRGDGGWSSYIGWNMSDPLATGRVLYALQQSSSDPPTADAIARAQHWLLKTQRDDGSWPIDITHVSKVDRSAPAKAKSFKDATGIFTYWGSGWATIGLLQSVPVK